MKNDSKTSEDKKETKRTADKKSVKNTSKAVKKSPAKK